MCDAKLDAQPQHIGISPVMCVDYWERTILQEKREKFMVRVALAQIFYKPAIIERAVDHLSEPGLVQGDMCATSLLKGLPQDKSNKLRIWQENTRNDYITYITRKLQEVCRQACHMYRPDLLVLPEYSVPCACLPVLQDLAAQYRITIVAGSHTVLLRIIMRR